MRTKKSLLTEVEELRRFKDALQQTVEVLKMELQKVNMSNTTLKEEVDKERKFGAKYKRICGELNQRMQQMNANREGLRDGFITSLEIVAAKNGNGKHRGVPVADLDDEMAMMGISFD